MIETVEEFRGAAATNLGMYRSYEARQSYKYNMRQRFNELSQMLYRGGFTSRRSTGCSLMTYTKHINPDSPEDLLMSYVSDSADNDEEGVDALSHIAFGLFRYAGYKFSPAECLAATIIRLIDNCYDGYKLELDAKRILENDDNVVNSGWQVREATENEDHKFGVDLIVEDDDKNVIAAFQVKPNSYFTKNPNPTLVRDREAHRWQMKTYESEYNTHVYFLKDIDIHKGILNPIRVS